MKRAFQYLILPIAILVIWQSLSQAGFIKPIILPPPSKVVQTFWDLIKTGQLPQHIWISILRVLEGFALAALLGIGLGIGTGLSQVLNRVTDLVIQLLKPVPPIAWIPLAILWFGIDELSKIYIIFLGAFFPIYQNVFEGIRNTDYKFVEVARILEVPRRKFICMVVIPGALPSMITGLRIGLGVAWMCVVSAELIAASKGVGYLIMDARQLSQTDVVLVGMITIGLIGKFMDSLLKGLENKLVGWKVAYSGE